MTSSATGNGKHPIRPAPPRTEEELLEREERNAREGLFASIQALGEDVVQATDLRSHMQRHPVVTLAAGTLGGVLLARPLAGLVTHVGGRKHLLGTIARLATHLASFKLFRAVVSAFLPDEDRDRIRFPR